MDRTTAIKTIQQLPPQFSMDDLFERLVFMEKVKERIKDADSGFVFSSKEAKKRLKKWLK